MVKFCILWFLEFDIFTKEIAKLHFIDLARDMVILLI